MWWQDAITLAVICLAVVSLITALTSAVLVLESAEAAHCDECGHAMITSHMDGTHVCLHCRFDHRFSAEHRHHDRPDRELASASRGV